VSAAAEAPTGARSPPPVLIVAGPTASGKSHLALSVAETFTGTVINADSMQVYGDLRVLTARPTAADEARVPHLLFGILSGAEVCSAGRWLAMAADAIAAAHAGGRLPIVVGGTGLYLKALTIGLAPVPEIPADVRAAARALYGRVGPVAFRALLAAADPASVARLAPGDGQRLVRAYEVVQATGRSLDDWRRAPPIRPLAGMRVASIVLVPPRQELYAAIDARFEAMIAEGALAEVEALLKLDPDAGLPVTKAVGVRELAAVVDGQSSLDDAVTAAKRASRNLAKRQVTWLRHQLTADLIVEAQFSERLRPKIFSFVRRFLLTPSA
jgi:tRNA dimethylallyltransferase